MRSELLAEIKHFFEVYKDLEAGKHVTVGEWEGRQQAIDAWGRGHQRWREQRGVTHAGHLMGRLRGCGGVSGVAGEARAESTSRPARR